MKIPKTYFPAVILLLIALILIPACSPPAKSDMATDLIYVSMTVESTGTGTSEVEVWLSVSGAAGTDVDLTNGDVLRVSAAGDSQLMARVKKWPYTVFYTAVLDLDDAGSIVDIDLERSNLNYVAALDSTVIIPDDIRILQPQANDTFSRTQTILVSWEPTGGSDEMSIGFDITCEEGQSTSTSYRNFSVSDTGSETIRVEDLLQDWELGLDASCSADLILIRKNVGTISPEFKSGKIIAIREASLSINIDP